MSVDNINTDDYQRWKNNPLKYRRHMFPFISLNATQYIYTESKRTSPFYYIYGLGFDCCVVDVAICHHCAFRMPINS